MTSVAYILGSLALQIASLAGAVDPAEARTVTPPRSEVTELGRLLFFDPVLSRDEDLSCAGCHRPERAFTDGVPTAAGRAGRRLQRNTPTLYDVGAKRSLLWDQRAPDLESQVFEPLLSPDELAADPTLLVGRLAAIPEYRARFERAFPELSDEERISLGTIATAIAAFERTLVSQGSRYDRWAAGDEAALSASETRGLALFRSLDLRCFECHRPPTFGAPFARATGLPGPDDGVGGVTGVAAQRGLFMVPSLRNVARTAPYMHDGSLATLEDVVRFYARGAGRALGAPAERVDPELRPFALSEVEVTDLVAFLGALTDEAPVPERPASVPSGLPLSREVGTAVAR